MTNPWPALARQYGRRSCVSLSHDEAALDAETARQAAIIFPLLQREFRGDEARALDYGCGAGRFSPYLADAARCRVNAYDPCTELLAEAPDHPAVFYFSDDRPAWRGRPYDIVFTAMVLGLPHTDVEAVAADLVSLLAPAGLLCALEHMPEDPPQGRWWLFRPFAFYRDLFARHGVDLRHIGSVAQFDNEAAITGGRRPRPTPPPWAFS